MFNITYITTGISSYRIILVPKGYAMFYNQPINVYTIIKNQSFYSTNGSIFLDQNFNLSATLNWTYANIINMTSFQRFTIGKFTSISNALNPTSSGLQ